MTAHMKVRTGLTLSFASLLPAALAAAAIPQGDLAIDLELLLGGQVSPVHVANAGDGTGRIFITDQTGIVQIVQNGVLLPTPFLNLTSEIVTVNTGFDERGLLGLAFHPDYANNGRFFVRYSKPHTGVAGEPCFGTSRGCHEEILAEYHVSASDPNIADPTGTILFRVNKPQFNHNGGAPAFGPDGYLYWGHGDGGGANDGLADVPPSHGPIGNGQNINAALGKLHRIDVDSGVPYAIPPDNPFASAPGLDEIFAYGFRNPFQFSFDDGPGGNNALWMADVGQNLFEEIDLVTNGGNYGWVIKEGFHCFNPFAPNTPPATCDNTGLTDPVAEYSHVDGISIIGAYVYRGSASPNLQGKYIFGDFSTSFGSPDGHIFYVDTAGPLGNIQRVVLGGDNHSLGRFIKSSGRDEAGEIYLCTSTLGGPTGTGGQVWRVRQRRCLGDADRNGAADFADITQILRNYGTNYLPGTGPGDSDSDGIVDFADVTATLRGFGPCP